MITADVLGERARLSPGRTALVSVADGVRYSYRDLDRRAHLLASGWVDRCGFAPGDRVGLLAHNRVEFIDAFFAAAKSGIILVPLGTRLTAREIAFIGQDAGLRGFMYGREFAATTRSLRDELAVERWIALDEPADPGDSLLADLLPPEPADMARPAPEDTCCLLYTSGTTGKPKGVMIPHRMVAWNGYNTAVCWGLREDDVSPIFTPLYHAGGLGAFLVPIFTVGGTIVLHAGFDTTEIWQTIERERCTVVLGVPTIYKLLMEAPEFERADLSHVRAFMSGGAPLPLYIIEAYQRRGVVFKQGYGLTEVGVNCFSMTVEESVRKRGSIGKPLMFTGARTVGEDGHDVATGEVGELWLRGPHVSKGYWRNPEATAAALDADGWFHTGDLARRDDEGFFYVAGRKKDMFISGGVNVYPAEVEGELLLHPSVKDAAVVGVSDETWGEIGAAFIVPREADGVSGDELAAFLAGRLAGYKIPRRWVLVDALPRTPYGKVVKAELSARVAASGPRVGQTPPGSASRPGTIAHRTDGNGEPVVLLNGGMMTIASWTGIAEALARRWSVVRCDFRGQLLSPGPPFHTTFAEHAADVIGVLDALGIPRAHIVSTSFGAEVGLLVAADYPDRVASLVAATVTDYATPAFRDGAIALGNACADALSGRSRYAAWDELSRVAYSEAYRAANAGLLAARRQRVADLPDIWFEGAASMVAPLVDLDLRPALPRIACPTLVLIAELDDVMPVDRSRALAAAIRGAEVEEVAGSGHALVVEQPAAFIAACERFLSRQPPLTAPGR